LRRFLVVGLLSVATDLAVYALFTSLLGVFVAASKAISYLVGVAVGFTLNKAWTFESARRTWTEPASYLLLYGVTLAVNVGCNGLVLSWLPERTLIAFLFATAVTTVLNFLGMRLVTFRKGIAERRAKTPSPNPSPADEGGGIEWRAA
jgi:putative flippase GtrA